MPEGGTLRFRCRAVRALPPELRAELDDDARAAAASSRSPIADTGSGMSEDGEGARLRAVLHDQGSRARHRPRPEHRVRLRQAVAAARSRSTARPAHGTTVTLYLPRLARQPTRRRQPTRPAGAACRRACACCWSRTMPRCAPSCSRFLDGAAAARSRACASGEQALAAARRRTRRFDLLLTDIALGAGMRGTELARRGAAALPGARRCC